MARRIRSVSRRGTDPFVPKHPEPLMSSLRGSFIRTFRPSVHRTQVSKLLQRAKPGEIVRVNGEFVARTNLDDERVMWSIMTPALLKHASLKARGLYAGAKFEIESNDPFVQGQKTFFVVLPEPQKLIQQGKFPFALDLETLSKRK